MSDVTIDPQKTDTERAEELMQELAEWCIRHRVLLRHAPGAITLAIENPAESNYRAIAQIKRIEPTIGPHAQMEWRPVAWRELKPHQRVRLPDGSLVELP